jgi:hypothetical protein
MAIKHLLVSENNFVPKPVLLGNRSLKRQTSSSVYYEVKLKVNVIPQQAVVAQGVPGRLIIIIIIIIIESVVPLRT